MAAPEVASEMVTVCAVLKVPPAGLKVGVATVPGGGVVPPPPWV